MCLPAPPPDSSTALPLPVLPVPLSPHQLGCDHHDHCPLLRQLRCLRQQVGSWRSLHQRACQREQQLRRQVAALEAQLRLLRQQPFGRRSETQATLDQLPAESTTTTPATTAVPPAGESTTTATAPPQGRRRRGQQPGKPGHGRRDHGPLPARVEEHAWPPDQQCCSQCGQPFADFPGTEDSTLLEVEVKAHRRIIRRRRYRPTCSCGVHPGIVTTPPPPRLLPKSNLGVSLWVTVLLDKYQFYRPTSRLLADLHSHGLDLAQGTVTAGRKRLVPLFEPLYEALVAPHQRQHFWHADETRWWVFASTEGKVGYRWYLWLFQSAEAVVFVLAAGRSHTVPDEHFQPVTEGILVVDRTRRIRPWPR